jgi:hypothetical protein
MKDNILSGIKHYFPHAGQNLSPTQIKERVENVDSLVRVQSDGSSPADKQAVIRPVIAAVERAIPEVGDRSQKEYLEGVARTLKEQLDS